MNEAVVLSTYETKLFLSLLLQFSFVLTSILLRIQSSVRVWDSRTVNILLGIQSSLRKMLMSFTESSLPVSLTESSVHEHSPENTELCKGVWLTSILLGIYRALSRECSWVLQRALYASILLRIQSSVRVFGSRAFSWEYTELSHENVRGSYRELSTRAFSWEWECSCTELSVRLSVFSYRELSYRESSVFFLTERELCILIQSALEHSHENARESYRELSTWTFSFFFNLRMFIKE